MNSFTPRATQTGTQFKYGMVAKLMLSSALVAAGTLTMFSGVSKADDYALPEGGVVVGGSSTITNPSLGNMNIYQSTDRTVINWDSFNIGESSTVTFYQPSQTSLAVNRVVGENDDPTKIMGTLRANGQVMVIDRNGVIFGQNSHINVGGLIATTGDVDTNSVMNGDAVLTLSNFGSGKIVNNGTITARDSGLVAFVGPVVVNNGVITARTGRVSLAAGNETATVDLYGDGLVELAYTDKDESLLSKNTGTINAVGGTIQMTAAAAKDVVDAVVNMKGIARANSATVEGGKIILSASNVKIGKTAEVIGDTTITAKTADLGTTIHGDVTGAVQTVNVLSNKAKIQQGMDIVNAGGTVNIGKGIYRENVVVDKEGVTINGAQSGVSGNDETRGTGNETVIWSGTGTGVTVTADDVTLDGLAIIGAGNGIDVLGADGTVIQNNIISTLAYGSGDVPSFVPMTADGIYLSDATNTQILNNYIFAYDSEYFDPSLSGNGINSYNSSGLTISGNTITGYGLDGIALQGGANNVISGNDIYNISGDGVFAQNINNLTVSDNDIEGVGGAGVDVLNGTGTTTIARNMILDTGAEGIYANNVKKLTVDANTISYTGSHGVYVLYSSNAFIKSNYIGTYAEGDNIHGDGVKVESSDYAKVGGNTIAGTIADATGHFGNGVYMLNSSNTQVYGNNISNIGWDGIRVDGGNTISVTGNTLNDINRVGVRTRGSANIVISSNTINNAKQGVRVRDAAGNVNVSSNTIDNVNRGVAILGENVGTILVSNNSINHALYDGVYINGSDNVTVSKNKIRNSGENAIYANYADGLNISGNTISTVGNTGVYIDNSNNAVISGNTISDAVYDGIFAANGDNVDITSNKITNVGHIGVVAEHVNDLTISLNNIKNAMYGIWYRTFSGDAEITSNTIDSVKVGIYSQDSTADTEIAGNTITNALNGGIKLVNNSDVSVHDNVIGSAADLTTMSQGLILINSKDVTASNNTINKTKAYGIYATGGSNLTFTGNTVNSAGSAAIMLKNTAGDVLVSDNTIHSTGGDGIYAVNESMMDALVAEGSALNLQIVNNTIESSIGEGAASGAAIKLDIGSDGYANVSGNTIDGDFEYGLLGYSGTIDLTGDTNTISNTSIGMGFYGGSDLNLVDDTIGTTAFVDQTDLFIDLGAGTFFGEDGPVLLDGMNATYTLGSATIAPSLNGYATESEYGVLESMINHYIDTPDRGLFNFPVLLDATEASFDQKDVIRTFNPYISQKNGVNLLITGLPRIGGGNGAPGNLNDISPAAGDEENTQDVANIEPAAGDDATAAACWADANQSLDNGGTAVLSYGGANGTGAALLKETASCGSSS
jgi:filamentous hemagglutinin family protein